MILMKMALPVAGATVVSCAKKGLPKQESLTQHYIVLTQLSELRKLRNSKFETRNPKQIRIFKCLNDQNTVDYGYFLAIKDYLDRFLKLESLLDSILEFIEKIEYFFNSES